MTPRLWLVAARPRTLPAAIAPVLVGTALAVSEDQFKALAFVAALVGSVFIQIGTNLSNDLSDARRGADTEDRLGPVRVTAGGLMPPRRVLIGTYVAFGVAVACGIYLTAEAGWEILVIGIASIVAGVLYTGGPRPYGYEGLGEVFVFLFFGVVAVTGSYFVQTEEVRWEAFVLSVPVGLLASAILVVNNVRDVDTDRRAGKRTLAVKLGRLAAVRLFAAMVLVAHAGARSAWPSPRAGPGCCCRWPRRRWCPRCCAPWAPAATARRSTGPWPTPGGCWPSSRCCWRRGSSSREALGAAAVASRCASRS